MADKINFTTGVGRLVQGSVSEPQTTDAEGKPLVVKNGPNAGQPRQDYFFAIAIDKNDPSVADLFAKMKQAAQEGFPRGEHQGARFAWKFVDGDSVDANGQPYSQRPGFAGCYVFKFSGGYPPGLYLRNSAGKLEQITGPNAIKRGYYVQVNGTISANGSSQQPGIYLNHSMVLLAGYGEEIVSGPDPEEAFKDPASLPAGASNTPVANSMPAPGAPGGAPAAGAPGAPGGAPAAGAPGAPGGAPAAGAPAAPGGTPAAGAPGAPGGTPAAGAPGAPGGTPAAGAPGAGSAPQGVSPAPDILDPNSAPTPEPQQPVEVRRQHSNGQVYTEAQLRAANWSDAQIQSLPIVQ